MDRTIYRISLDVQANVCQRELNMRKKESGRRIIASLRDGSAHYHMEPDCRAVFSARKPDGKIIYNECIIDGCEIVYDITEQTTAAPGITKCEFLVYGGDSLLLVSPKFFIRVEDTVYNDGDEIESTSEFSALTAAMAEVNRLIEEVKNLGNDIDPEVLAAAVEEYLAANPTQETDPTVPAWAKQPTKPEYTAEEVGALPSNTVIPTVPTKVSAFANDKGYQTEAEVNALINTALGVIENGTY